LSSCTLAHGFGENVKDASVINGVLWVVTDAATPTKNLHSYDGTWVSYASAPAGSGGNIRTLLPGPDAKPLVQMADTVNEWRTFDQGADNFINPRFITPGRVFTKSFGTIAQLNMLLMAVVMMLVFIQ